jgi:hypothetical protein
MGKDPGDRMESESVKQITCGKKSANRIKAYYNT